MDRLRKWHCTAVALLLMLTVVATPVIAKTRITSRGIELPGDGPQTDTTGEPDTGSGGLPRDLQLMELVRGLRLLLLPGLSPIAYMDLGGPVTVSHRVAPAVGRRATSNE